MDIYNTLLKLIIFKYSKALILIVPDMNHFDVEMILPL